MKISIDEILNDLKKWPDVDPLILRPIRFGERTHPQFRVERKSKKFVVEPNEKEKFEFDDIDEAVKKFNETEK